MTAHYGFIRQSLTPGTDYTIAATSGGTTTTGGSLWFALHSENRQGVNLPGTLTQVTWTAGQKVVITINSSARATGEEPFRYTLAAATTNTPANLRQLAYIWAIDPVDQRTPEALPLTLELTRDQDFVLAGTSATVAALPASPLDGTMRTVTADGLRYEANNGIWTATLKPFSTYLASTADANGGRVGCDRPLNQLSSAVIIEPLPYTPDGSLQASPVRIDFSNGTSPTGGPLLPQGTAMAFQLFVAGQDVTTRFSGKVYVTLLGYVDRATGILDTTPSGTGAALPYTYLSSGTGRLVGSNILLPRDLARGFAAAYRVALKVSAEELNATGEPFADGSAVEILVTPIPPRGFYDSSYNITGNLVYQDPGLEYLRILPTVSGVERQGGVCTIAGYTSPLVDTQSLSGLTADLALQKIAIDATLGAQVTLRSPGATLLPTEALRALISTTPGSYTASPWQTPIAITLGQNLTITVTHPTTIRSNYPDRIAGTVAAFAVPRVRVFVRLSSIIYELPTPLTVAPGSTQTATTISSLSGWTSGATLPNSSASPGFGLYGYGAIVPSGGGSGSSLGAGSYEVAIAWHYPSPNTRATTISHAPNDGCIPEAEGTFSDLFANRGKVLVSPTDTTISFLEDKLAQGNGITLATLNPGADESIQIAATGQLRASASDTTFAFLGSKLSAGNNITLTTLNPGANESIRIAAGGYSTIQDEGVAVTQRGTLNFIGSPVVVTDDGGGTRTQVTITAYTTFTGDPTGFTPTVANQLHVKTDNSPNLLYRSTGTTAGALTAIGSSGQGYLPSGQGYFLRYTAALAVTTTAAGEWGTNGTTNGGVDPITQFYVNFSHLDSVASESAYTILAALGQNSVAKLYGESSGVQAWYCLYSIEELTEEFQFGATLLDDDGDFTDGENLLVQFVNTPIPFTTSQSGNFGLDGSSPRRYFVDCTSGNITATLPLAANAPGIAHLLKRTDNSGYILTLARSGSDTIDGETSQTLAGLESVTVHSDGVSKWYLS